MDRINRTKRILAGGVVLLAGFALRLATAAAAFDAADYFEKKCSSCHTVGGGDDIGPDLKGVTERRTEDWIVKMVQSSQALIKSGDPTSNELFAKFKNKKMPDQDLTPDEIKLLMAFIKQGGPGEKPVDAKPATAATPQDIAMGRELFLGARPLANGGPACISCHSAGSFGPLGGGSLGPDLTQVYSRYEDDGLSKALRKMGFNVMREIYIPKPLTADEAFAIKAFLLQTDQQGQVNTGFQKKFVFLGIGGCVFFLGIFDLSWRKRRKKTAKPVRGGFA
ncbi:MAG: cytochrome c [bacterium]